MCILAGFHVSDLWCNRTVPMDYEMYFRSLWPEHPVNASSTPKAVRMPCDSNLR